MLRPISTVSTSGGTCVILIAILFALGCSSDHDKPRFASAMRIAAGELFGTTQREPAASKATDFELEATTQCRLEASAREVDDGSQIETAPYRVRCAVPPMQRELSIVLPVQVEARDAADWYLFVDHDVLEADWPLGVSFDCGSGPVSHSPAPGAQNAASLRVTLVNGVRFEHEAPEPDYRREARFDVFHVLTDGCLLNLNGSMTFVQTASDWQLAN
jgi:hypothetical protein